jgi:hypothetical protein
MEGWPPYFRVRDVPHFLAAVCEAVRASPDWREEECDGMYESCIAKYIGRAFRGQDLGLVLMHFGEPHGRVQLTMHARRWGKNELTASDNEYAAAEQLTMPLFEHVRRALRRRLALHRPRDSGPRPLSSSLSRAFERFTCIFVHGLPPFDKVNAIHPNDEMRFLAFVRCAHQHRSRLSPDDVSYHLRVAGFGDDLIRQLTEQYETGRRILVSVRRTTGQLRVPPAGNVLRACSAAGQGFGR